MLSKRKRFSYSIFELYFLHGVLLLVKAAQLLHPKFRQACILPSKHAHVDKDTDWNYISLASWLKL